jgi:hypothetical protein
MPVGMSWDWGCKHCTQVFETLSEAMVHARDAHDVDPFNLLPKTA